MQPNGQITQGSVQIWDRSIEEQRLLSVLRLIEVNRNTREKTSASRSNGNGAINAIICGVHLRDALAHAVLAQRSLSAAGHLHAVPAIVQTDLRRAVAGLRRLQAVGATREHELRGMHHE